MSNLKLTIMKTLINPNALEEQNATIEIYNENSCSGRSCLRKKCNSTGRNDSIETEDDILF